MYVRGPTSSPCRIDRVTSSPMPTSITKRLTEIESSLVDAVKSNNAHNHVIADGREKVIVEEDVSLVVDCMALPSANNYCCYKTIDNDVSRYDDDDDDDEDDTNNHAKINIIAYCILSPTTLSQFQRNDIMSLSSSSWRTAGVKASRLSRPLHSVFRARCPSPEDVEFLIVDKFPDIGGCAVDERVDITPSARASLSASSPNQPQRQKHLKNQQTSLSSSTAWSSISSNHNNPKHNNKHKNKIFRILTQKITSVLNIPPSQRRHLLTANANFASLGGDSMAAALVARGLYAVHFRIEETRHLGGRTGVLGSVCLGKACEHDENDNGDGIDDDGWFFDTKYFLKCETLGEYVEFLEENGAFRHCHNCDDDVEYDEAVERHDETWAPPGDDCSFGDSDQGDERLLQPERVDDDFDATNNSHRLYNHLMEAITLGHRNIALALLQYVDFDDTSLDNTATNNSSSMQSNVNAPTNKARLGKISDRRQQRKIFQSNPLHLACVRGDAILVEALLGKGCKANVPNATGSFPIHLACSCRLNENRIRRSDVTASAKNGGNNRTLALTQMETGRCREDTDRIKCVKLLLEAGTPISIKSGSKQTILHCAARSGHLELLQFVMERWKTASAKKDGIKFRSIDVATTECVRDSDARSTSGSGAKTHIFEWYDRWHRTPVHWAILNERVDALKLLLDGGCKPTTTKPKSGVKSSSILIETPLEMVSRLYGRKDGLDENSDPTGVGKMMKELLLEALREEMMIMEPCE